MRRDRDERVERSRATRDGDARRLAARLEDPVDDDAEDSRRRAGSHGEGSGKHIAVRCFARDGGFGFWRGAAQATGNPSKMWEQTMWHVACVNVMNEKSSADLAKKHKKSESNVVMSRVWWCPVQSHFLVSQTNSFLSSIRNKNQLNREEDQTIRAKNKFTIVKCALFIVIAKSCKIKVVLETS